MSRDGRADSTEKGQRSGTRFGPGMVAPCRHHAYRDHRRRRHVVCGSGASRSAGGVRRPARRGLVAVHAGDAGICRRRRHHGSAIRSSRHFGADRHWRRVVDRRLPRRCRRRQSHGICAGACHDWIRQLGDFGAADGGHFLLVRPPPRPGRHLVLVRELHCRSGVAAGGAAWHCAVRLARDACKLGADLWCGDGWSSASSPCGGERRPRFSI